jgi:hypothetical protein
VSAAFQAGHASSIRRPLRTFLSWKVRYQPDDGGGTAIRLGKANDLVVLLLAGHDPVRCTDKVPALSPCQRARQRGEREASEWDVS